ncbi:hypothetical protein [Rhodophyticola sp.]|jgi:hypothetical protein|uniref:hypothetical protein n=1 Tax=Rhodophyticola sp. TaxID=2680032 RepID=UPI003D28A507
MVRKQTELPEAVTIAIASLRDGEKSKVGDAHDLLQDAVLGRQGCLRTDKPQPVDWAEAAWDEFITLMAHDNNHARSIAGQVLSNLAQSVPPETALRDLDKVSAATRDQMFVTARHVLQSMWKFGLGTKEVRRALVAEFADLFRISGTEKNPTLRRFDIVTGLRALFDETGDDSLLQTARDLISLEDDPTYRKKYSGVWRDLIDR